MTFPIDWDEWRQEWSAWRKAHADSLKPSSYKFPPKNFLADEILGVWSINGRAVELSEVTMPDFSAGYGASSVRFIGITYGAAGTVHLAGPIVSSFAELEQELGI